MRWGQAGRLRFQALGLAVCLFAGSNAARAVTDEEIFREYRFNFINPGARALGMGGAFVSIADDATAALANPAGLNYLDSPEFFAELRSISKDTQVFESNFGSLEVDLLTGERDLPFLSVKSVSESDTLTEPSFVSLAWPLRLGQTGRRLTLTGSRQVVLSDDRALQLTNQSTEMRVAFDSFPNTVNDDQLEAYSIVAPVTGENSTEIIYWNVGTSLELHSDFSMGLTVSLASMEIESHTTTRVNDPLALFLDPTHPRLPAQPSADVFRSMVDDSDTGFAWTFGIHWHPDSVFAGGVSPWRFGAVFRKGAEFNIEESTFINEAADGILATSIVVPDRYSIGASYHSGERWTVAIEVERVEYSDMMKDFQSGINFLTGDRLAEFFDVDPEQSVVFNVDDGTVPRIGGEYRFPLLGNTQRRFSARAGYFRTPDSRIHMAQFNSTDPEVNDVFLDAFRGAEEKDHFTAGVGFVWGRSAFHIAGDFSDEESQVVGSYIFKLGQP